jgi:hypothetical protein
VLFEKVIFAQGGKTPISILKRGGAIKNVHNIKTAIQYIDKISPSKNIFQNLIFLYEYTIAFGGVP